MINLQIYENFIQIIRTLCIDILPELMCDDLYCDKVSGFIHY